MNLQYKDALGHDIIIGGVYGKTDYRDGEIQNKVVTVLELSIKRNKPALVVMSKIGDNNPVKATMTRMNQLWAIYNPASNTQTKCEKCGDEGWIYGANGNVRKCNKC